MKSSRIVRTAAIAAVGTLGALLPISVAGAAYPGPDTGPSVLPKDQGSTQVAPNNAVRPATLPFTGTDVAELVAIGGASIGVGMVLARRSRKVSTS
jgi:hypothetical protein